MKIRLVITTYLFANSDKKFTISDWYKSKPKTNDLKDLVGLKFKDGYVYSLFNRKRKR